MYLLAINQALPYGCSFVTYGHPEGSAAGDIWNDVFNPILDGGGGQMCPPSWFFECSSETVRSRKLKLCDF